MLFNYLNYNNFKYFISFIFKPFIYIYMLDHKCIGISYILIGVFSGFIGSFLSSSIRLELHMPGSFYFSGSSEVYNISVTVHGIIMIFFAVMPIFISGLGNYFIPLMVGSRDMSLPRLNNIAFFILLLSLLFLSIPLFLGAKLDAASCGWTMYPPLSIINNECGLFFLIISLHFNGISSLINSINTISTIQFCSCLNKWHISIFSWSLLITSYLLLFVLPVLVVGISFLLSDSIFGSCFYCVSGGGDPVLYQHLFWFFGHPEVYILILPVFGLVSEFITDIISRKVLGYKVMIWSMISIAFLGTVVWAHHMFTVGMELDSLCYFTISTSVIAVPTGLKIILWISSFLNNKSDLDLLSFYSLLFIFTFVIGGVTGIWLAQAELDLLLHDTYYVIAHFHYVMAVSIIYVFFAFIYKWHRFYFGVSYDNVYSRVHLLCFFIGVNLLFAPMHISGVMGMPRRVFDYPSCFVFWNQISTLGLILVFISLLWFFLSLHFIYKENSLHKLIFNNLFNFSVYSIILHF